MFSKTASTEIGSKSVVLGKKTSQYSPVLYLHYFCLQQICSVPRYQDNEFAKSQMPCFGGTL
jgi:hypothetical protein